MKLTTKLTIVAGLLAASLSAFAANEPAQPGYKYVQCPPASALHHVGVGQPWTLDEPYKSEGWLIMQTPEVNWNYLLTIPKTTPLSVRVTDESAYLNTGKTVTETVVDPDGSEHDIVYNVFDAAGGSFPVTCSYPYKIVKNQKEDNFTETLIVKSPYTSTPNFGEDSQFKSQTDSVDYPETMIPNAPFPESNWGWVCNTKAGTPEACKFLVADVSQSPNKEALAKAKLKVKALAHSKK